MMNRCMIGIAALVAAAGTASAQFSVSGTNVYSVGPEGDPGNGTISNTYGGSSTIFGQMDFTGTLTNPFATGTYASEAEWAITNGFGATVYGAFQSGTTFTDPIPVSATINGMYWINNGDTVSAEASESYDDPGDDAVWADADFTFSGGVVSNYLGILPSSFTVDTLASDYDTELAVFTAAGALIGNNDDVGTGPLQSELVISGLAAGDYYIVVGGYNTVFLDGYAFAGSSAGNLSIAVDGSTVATGTGLAGELNIYTFSVPTPGSLALLGLAGLGVRRRR